LANADEYRHQKRLPTQQVLPNAQGYHE